MQALVLANMVNGALAAYEAAIGAGSEEHGHGEGGESSHDTGTIVDRQAYEASKAFATKAYSMYGKVKRAAPAGSEEAMAAAKAGLKELGGDIRHKEPVDKVIVLVHSTTHKNIKAYSLKLSD